MLSRATRLSTLLPLLLLTGCIGAHDASGIREEAMRRGGGAEPFVIREAEAAVARKLSTEAGSVRLASIDILPLRITMVAADPRHPQRWDRYVYANGTLDDTQPLPDRARPAFQLDDFRALERLPALVAAARAQVDDDETRFSGIRIAASRDDDADDGTAPPQLRLTFTNPRNSGKTLRYDADGRPL